MFAKINGRLTLKSIAALLFAFVAAFSSSGMVPRDAVLECEINIEFEEAVSRSRPDESSLGKKQHAGRITPLQSVSKCGLLTATIDLPTNFYSEISFQFGIGRPLTI